MIDNSHLGIDPIKTWQASAVSYETVHHNDDDRPASAKGNTTGGVPFKLIAFFALVAVVAVFVVQNGQKADVDFLFFDAQWPLWTVIAVSVLSGAVIDRLGGWLWRRSRNNTGQHDDE